MKNPLAFRNHPASSSPPVSRARAAGRSLLVLLLAATTSFTSHAQSNLCAATPSGLVAWWSGDNSPAELIHGNNGTLSGGAVYTNAIVGAGFSLDGLDDRVVVADAPVLDFGSNQDLSIECWIKAYPNSNPSNVRAIVDKRNAAENYRGYTLFLWDGFLAFQLSEISKGVNYFSSGADLRDGVFHHVAVTVDRDSASGGRLYVDGQIIYTFDPTGVMGDLSNSDVLRIGQHATPGGSSSFLGVIDDIAIYNRALSTAEVQSVYQAGSAGKCAAVAPAPMLLNVDFGAGLAGTTKTGFAAIGQTSADFWNFYTRDDGAGGWRTFGVLPDLKTANGVTTAIGMAVINAPGAWGNGSSDPMYVDYIYPFDGGNVTVVVSNLPAGQYDVLAYGYDGNYEVFSAGQYRGVQTNYDAHRSNPPVWTPGLQYVHFTNIIVAPWEPLVLTARPGRDGYAVISGMQIAAAITNVVAETNCTTIPAGLVAWWRGEGNASDENGVNNGTLLNGTTFAGGEVGQAFVFNDATTDVRIPASPSINVGIGAGFTIEAWIAPATLTPQPVFEWNSGTGYDDIGAHLWISASPSGAGAAGNLFANLRDTAGGSHFISSAAGVVVTNRFQHVALTYDKASGAAVLYCNGIAVADQNVGALTLFTTYDLHLGRRAGGYFSEAYYRGMIDEASLYSRALSAVEIQSIYNAASAGKCPATNPPPQVSTVPVITSFSPTVATVGGSVTVFGTNFSPVSSSNIVYFGVVRAGVTAASSNLLTVTVPIGATHAPITVTVDGLTATARTAFTPTFVGSDALTTASFSPRVNMGTGDGPTGTAIADFDGDGKPDLAVTDDYGHTLSVYRNISVAGTLDASSFAPRVVLPARPTEYSPYMIVTGDVDGDGKLDLITTDVGGNSVSVYRNQAVSGDLNSNSFALFVSFAVGAGPRAVALADLDADGRPEIVTANYDASTVSVLRNIGVAGQISSNSFAPRFDLSAGAGAHGLAVADLDGDGRPDLATANAVGASLSLFRNVGSGPVTSNSFAAPVTLSGPNFAHFVRAADLDADGRSELLLTSYLGQTLTVYRNQADSGVLDTNSFAAGITLALAGRGHTISLGDLNGDTKVDIAVDTEIGDSIALFQNQSVPGGFTNDSLAARVDLAAGWNAWGSSVGDLDGDGRPDIIFANAYDDTISLYRNLTTLSNQPPVSCAPTPLGLVASWRAEGNAVDVTGNHNGIITTQFNGSVSFSPGKVGTAFDFTGSDFVELQPFPLTNFTIECWLNQRTRVPVTPNSSWGCFVISDEVCGVADDWHLGLLNGGQLLFHIGDGAGGGDYQFPSTNTIPLNTYVHVAVTRSTVTGKIELYINGVLDSTFTAPHNRVVGMAGPWCDIYPNTIGIGNIRRHAALGISNNFDGLIDEPAIYSQALSAVDIAAIYHAGSAGKCATNPPLCTPPSSGLVSWWRAENNGGDIISGNTGDLLDGTSFGPGQVGQAFQFDGAHDSIRVAARAATDVGTQAGFTIEAWINPTRISIGQIAEWNNGASGTGVHLWHSVDTFVAGDGVANLYANLVDTSGISHALWSPAGLVTTNGYNHVALTYDKTTGIAELFHNGVSVRSTNLGSFTPQTSYDLYFGKRASGPFSEPINHFQGTMDEVSLYSRALAQTEIQAIYNAGSAGKCPPTAVAPNISHQPQSATVGAGANVQLDVTATGIPAPTYQWFFAADSLAGQTNATLFLNNVQPSQAGDYFVIVANPSGSVTSAVATLTVQTFPPTITSQPQDQTVYAGKTVTLRVQATGTAPLRYHWSQNGTELSNAVAATLTLPNVQSNHAGIYQVVVSNDYGSATSRLAQLTVTPPPPCTPAPDGVIAWWPGQSNLWDVVGGFDGRPSSMSLPANLFYTAGKVGAAYSISEQYVVVSTGGGLSLNTNNGLTIEGWIRPNTLSGPRPIAEWNDSKTVGAGLLLSIAGPGVIEATLTDTNVPIRSVTFRSPVNIITNSIWQHVALTYDKSTGLAKILVNGSPVTQTNIGTMTPNTSGNVYLGYRPAGVYVGSRFWGALDEITLYNRALSAAELQSIIAADETGKCPPPPPPCIKPPADIAAWWRGESNTVDSVAGNDAIRIPTNYTAALAYQAGQLGTAFSFKGQNFLSVPRSEGLDVGAGSGLTVEAWIYPNTFSPMPIVEWTDTNSYGANLWLSYSRGPSVLEANLIDNGGGFHLIRSPVNTIRSAAWQHVAVTYDKTTGVAALYSDGNLVTTTNLGFFTPRTHTELLIGFHPRNTVSGPDGTPPTIDYRFNGAIDELAIYRRALSAAEIRNVARPRPGKCLELPPTISRHPQEQVALEGGTARFEVGVGGTAPFQYQWLFAGEAIANATNSFLALTGVEPADASPYSVLVSNAFGSVTSRVAALTVLPANQCLPTPYGAVAFWRGQSNTLDELGSHPAAWGTNTLAAYTSTQTGGGKVATAFRFTGQNHLVVPTNSNLDVGAGGGFTIEGWIKPDSLSGAQPVWDWNDGLGNIGVGLLLGRTGAGMLEVTLTDTNVISTQLRVVTLTTPNFTLGSITNQIPAWSHVALTFDKATGKLNLFVNGKLVGEQTIGLVPGGVTSGAANKLFSPVTTGNLHFGWRRSGVFQGSRFRGAMDEMSVYYRALTPLELQAIYIVGANGKCTPAPACQPLASGIISWWRGESNVLDSVDGNHGSNNPAPLYTNGIVGSGFRITSGRYIQIPAQPALNVGTGAGFTFETWLRRDIQTTYTIAAWNSGSLTQGVSFGSSPTRGPDYFEANLVDTLGNSHVLSFYTYVPGISGGLIPVGKWNHLALTYEKLSGKAILFLNGSPVVATNVGSFTPRTLGNLYLGYRPPGNYPGSGTLLTGALDETALYNRALSSGEITANYRNVANRCMMPPVIVSYSENMRVNPGSDVTLRVIAEGSPLLRYQWSIDFFRQIPNFALPGQTNSVLLLTDVQFKDSGYYWVQVTNAFGAAVSSNINLIVNSPPNAFNQSLTTAEDSARSFLLLASDANQDPLAFTVLTQPTNGTLSHTSSNWVYTPAPNYNGPDSFTFKVSDGLLESAPANVSITVTPVNDPPTAASQFVATDEDTPLPITLAAADVDGDALTFNITPPTHGTLSGTAPNLVYTPHANFFGDDLFMFTVRDGSNAVSELAVVSITVHPVNDVPIARIVVAPLDELPGVTNLVALAPACCEATLRLDASESSDVENDALTYTWLEGTNILSTAIAATNRFNAGTHEITLLVSDGTNITSATVIVEIITPAEAIAFLQTLVEEGITETRDRMPLLNWLNGASEAMERCQVEQGLRFLESFQQRIRDRIASKDAELAAALIETSTAIMEAAPDCDPSQRLGRLQKPKHEDRGRPESPSTDSARSPRTR